MLFVFLFVLFGLNTFHVCIIFFNVLYFPCDPSPLPLSFPPIMCVRIMWLCHMTLAWCWWCRLRWWTEGNFCWFYFILFCFVSFLFTFGLIPINSENRQVNEGKIEETPTQYHQDLWAISFLSHSSFRNLTPPTLFGFLKTISHPA